VTDTSTDLIIAVFTCPKHAERAQAVRDTWWNGFASNAMRLFVECRPGEVPRLEGETLVLDAPEAYESLPQKTIAFLEYCLEHYPAHHIYKCDDDTFVNVPRLLDQPWQEHDYYGEYFTRLDLAPRDWHFGKCEDKSKEVPYDRPIRSPWMLGGAGYFLSPRAARLAVERSRSLLADALYEDVMIGEALHNQNLKVGGVPAFSGRMGTVHPCPPTEMRMRHDTLSQQLAAQDQPLEARKTDIRLSDGAINMKFQGVGRQESRVTLSIQAADQVARTLAEAVRLARSGAAPRPDAQGVFAVQIDARCGLFTQLVWGLEILAHCNRHGLTPRLRFSGVYALPGETDWFKHFFRHRNPVQPLAPYAKIRHIADLQLPEDYNKALNFDNASALLSKHFELLPEWRDRVDDFWNEHFAQASVLGAHYRGTDKTSNRTGEAPAVDSKDFIQRMRQRLEKGGYQKLFLASDDPAFIEKAQEELSDQDVTIRQDHCRANGQTPAHYRGDGDPHEKAVDALETCLLLSRCDALIKTASTLSGWAKVFNTALPVELLNPPHPEHCWFPDRELIAPPA